MAEIDPEMKAMHTELNKAVISSAIEVEQSTGKDRQVANKAKQAGS